MIRENKDSQAQKQAGDALIKFFFPEKRLTSAKVYSGKSKGLAEKSSCKPFCIINNSKIKSFHFNTFSNA
jgi:hypothetical protein